jgi:hypothetical protein
MLAGLLASVALLAHPMGLIYSADLAIAILWLDWRRLRFVHVATLAGAYLVCLSLEAFYILQAPTVFYSQLHASAAYRVGGISATLRSIAWDPIDRYWFNYFSGEEGIHRAKVLSLVAGVAGLIAPCASRGLRKQPGVRLLLVMALVSVGMVAVIDNQKFPLYFVHSFVPAIALAGIWLCYWWPRGGVRRAIAVICVGTAIASTVAAFGIKIKQNARGGDYARMVQTVQANLRDGGIVMGGSELGFGLGFHPPLVDDRYLGYFSGIRPDVYVENNYYPVMVYPREPVARYIHEKLETDYKQILRTGDFRVWVRRP